MKLNHLNLAVTNVAEAAKFLRKYFGLRGMDKSEDNDNFDVMFDDGNFVLTLMKVGENAEVNYPPSFHIGFIQESEEKVNEINQQLKNDGFEVKQPRHFHGSWTFYFKAPGGFTIEVLC